VAAKGFDIADQSYDIGRPSYPQQFITKHIQKEFPKGDQHVTVMDLACGTGKLTTHLVAALNKDTTRMLALEPAKGMRESFSQKFPNIDVMSGGANAIPLLDDCLDAIFVGQAFHWFANEESLKEMHRVLKPRGLLSLWWNLEDNSVPWIKELRDQFEQYEGDTPQFRLGLWRQVWKEENTLFDPIQEDTFEHVLESDVIKAWHRIKSKSYINVLSKEKQETLRQRVLAILERHGLADGKPFPYPQITTNVYTRAIK